MDESPDVLTRLSNLVKQLEQRVYVLEHPYEAAAAHPESTAISPGIAVRQPAESPSSAPSGSMFAVLGKAMLGIAGGYVLRAIAESGSVPKPAVVALAIAYAAMWLGWAIRVPAQEWLASTIYAGTSALILAPMLWELTLRFKVLTPLMAAGVLATYVFAAYLLAWRRNLMPVVWVASLTTAITAITLLVATHEMLPFISTLLLMVFLSEYAAASDRWRTVRPVAAIASDIAIWSLIFIYSAAESSRADYANLSVGILLAPAIILFLIYGVGVAQRTCFRRQTITVFEVFQTAITFLLVADAVLHFAPTIGVSAFATFCLVFSIAGYAALFLRFDAIDQRRNYQVYGTWSMALLLMGCFLFLGSVWLPLTLGVAAVATTYLAVRESRLTLAFHGLIYLLAAAFACGCFQYATHALVGVFPAPPAGIAWIVTASIIVCYAIGGQFAGEHWKLRLFHVISAALAVGAMASILVSGMVWITATIITPGASHIAVIRSLGACSLALALAFIGSRWNRLELVWVAYGTLALVTVKLLFEDLRQGHPEFIAASIFIYAVTLITVPRLVRRSSRKSPTAVPEILTATVPIADHH